MTERTGRRLFGIARYHHRRFRVPYDMIDDLIQTAWMLWLERPTVSEERRFQQVHGHVRLYAMRWLIGYVPHGGKMVDYGPLYRNSAFQVYTPDFQGSVTLRQIVERCELASRDHIRTVAMLAGLEKPPKVRKTFKDRRRRLRRFLESQGLAA